MTTYRIGDVSELTGASRRQLGYWRRRGFICPSGKTSDGGHHRYTDSDIRRVRLLLLMTGGGKRAISVCRAVHVLDALHQQVETWLEAFHVPHPDIKPPNV